MCVFVCVGMCVFVYVCECVFMFEYVSSSSKEEYVSVLIGVCMCVFVFMCACGETVRACVRACVCVCARARACVCVCLLYSGATGVPPHNSKRFHYFHI